jgi:S-(hydroxymethyl)glutathione dehydrogenase/alcohol dehydrogenase
MGEREIVRTSYGRARPRQDFPRLADLALAGELRLEELITMRLPLADINRGFDELRAGLVARAVVIFD